MHPKHQCKPWTFILNKDLTLPTGSMYVSGRLPTCVSGPLSAKRSSTDTTTAISSDRKSFKLQRSEQWYLHVYKNTLRKTYTNHNWAKWQKKTKHCHSLVRPGDFVLHIIIMKSLVWHVKHRKYDCLAMDNWSLIIVLTESVDNSIFCKMFVMTGMLDIKSRLTVQVTAM